MTTTNFYDAIVAGDLEQIDRALDDGADINAPLTRGNNVLPPLVIASMMANPVVVRHLLDRGANVHVRESNGSTALHITVYMISTDLEDDLNPLIEHNNYYDVAQILLDAGAQINGANPYTGNTVVHIAAGASNPHLVRWLVERGAALHADQRHANSASSYLVAQRKQLIKKAVAANAPLQPWVHPITNNPSVQPWRETLAVLTDLAQSDMTSKVCVQTV